MQVTKVSGESVAIAAEQQAKLRELFPEAFSEGEIDWQKLKAVLGAQVEQGERYGLSWKGKSDVYATIQESTTKTLRPAPEESVEFETTQNVFIEGDNLDTLKVLQKAYYGQIKMIYIDPPYNTGNDFVYRDKFAQTRAEYEQAAGLRDEHGQATRADGLTKNTRDNGHYHSDWLSMMYPRLYLARNLLRQDGVIFVSIDDNEVHNLRLVMNEVFGEENFVAQIIWIKKYASANDVKGFSENHDYILAYRRSDEFARNLLARSEKQDILYKYNDNDGRGRWRADNLSVRTYSVGYDFPITNPNTAQVYRPPKGRSWVTNRETIDRWVVENRIFFGKTGTGAPQLKRYLSEVQQGVVPSTVWTYDEAGHNDESRKEIKDIFGTSAYFDTPKPTRLIKRLLMIAMDKDDLVLDFFAGSGTTAHAVMQLNAEDGGNRRWICVQLPEQTDEASEAYKAGYRTIADIARERIRRAGRKIRSEDRANFEGRALDTGFKSFRLTPTNFKIWDEHVRNPAKLKQQLLDHLDPVKPGALEADLLTELTLKSGIDLTAPRQTIQTPHGTYYRIAGSLLICLAPALSEPLFAALLAERPEKIILLDSSLHNDDQLKTNLLLQAKGAGVEVGVV